MFGELTGKAAKWIEDTLIQKCSNFGSDPREPTYGYQIYGLWWVKGFKCTFELWVNGCLWCKFRGYSLSILRAFL